MKAKILALIVMAMLVFSIAPMAFARNTENNAGGNSAGITAQTGNNEIEEAETGEPQTVESELETEGPVTAGARIKETVRARIAEVKAIPVAQRVEAVAALAAESFRQFQQEKLMLAVEKCKEKNLSAELCEKKFEKRIALIEKLNEKDLARLQKIQEQRLEHLKEFNEMRAEPEFAKFKLKEFKAREIAKENLEKAKENFAKNNEKYLKAKENYVKAQERFRETKQKIAACKDSESEECVALELQIKERSKDYLLNAADKVLAALGKLKEKVNSAEDITAEEASELIAKIDASIAEIEAAKENIAALTTESTKEEIKAAAKALRDAWKEVRAGVNRAAGIVVNSRIGGILVKSEHLKTKLNIVFEKATEQGKDTTALEALIADFNAKLANAEESYKLAVYKYKAAKATIGADAALKEAHEYMVAAHSALKEAHVVLKDIFKELKKQDVEEEVEAEEESDAQETAEAEVVGISAS